MNRDMPFALLGMNFLNRMEMRRDGSTLTLETALLTMHRATVSWLRACFSQTVPTHVVLESGVPDGALTPAARPRAAGGPRQRIRYCSPSARPT